MIAKFEKIVIRLLVIAILVPVMPTESMAFRPGARETKQQKRENTARLRAHLGHLYRSAAHVSRSKDIDEDVKKTIVEHLKSAEKLWGMIEHRLSEARANAIKTRLHQAQAMANGLGSDHAKEQLLANLDELLLVIYDSFIVLTTPAQTPDHKVGERVFRSSCASCHGAEGRADGILSSYLNPPPISFHDLGYLSSLSPFAAFNTVIRGIDGQAKKSFEHQLTAHEMWSVAFYAIGLVQTDKPLAKEAAAREWFVARDGSLALLARLNDRQLLQWLQESHKKSPLPGKLTVESLHRWLRRYGVYGASLDRN